MIALSSKIVAGTGKGGIELKQILIWRVVFLVLAFAMWDCSGKGVPAEIA